MLRRALLRTCVFVAVLSMCSSCGRSATSYLESGDKLFLQKDFRAALVDYRNAVRKDPLNGEAHHKLGESFVALGDEAAALPEFVRAADLLPKRADIQLEAIRSLILSQQFEDARSRAEALIRIEPQNADAHIARAQATAGMRDLDLALKALGDAEAIQPTQQSYVAIGSVQLAKGRQAEAEAAFKQAIVVSPRSIPAHLALANFYWRVGNRTEAERVVRDSIAIEPGNALANRVLSVMLIASGRSDEAEGSLSTAAAAGAPVDRLALADYLVTRKKFADARAVLTSLKQEKDASAAAGARLAGIEYEEGHRDRAFQLVDEVIRAEPGNLQMRALKGGWLLGEKRLDDAYAVAQDMLRIEPKSADAHGMLGAIYMARGQADDAIAEFGAVISVAPKAAAAKVQLAQLYLAKGQVRQALDAAQESVDLSPRNAVAHIVLSKALLANGDVDRAMAQLRPLAETAPKEPDVQLLMGQIQLRQRDLAAAKRSFARALELNPASVESLEGLVAAELGGKARGDAIAVVDARVAQRPRDASMLLLAGRTHITVGDLSGAEGLLKRAIDADPGLMAAYHVLGQVYVRQSKLDAALAEYQALVLKNPKLVPAQTMVALLLHAQNRLDEARERYETVLAIDPRAAVAANNVAYIDAEAGRNLNVAMSRAQTAKAALPDDPDVNDTLGWVFYKQGLATSAIPPLEQSVAKDGNNPTYRYHLGMAYWKAGNTVKARESLERALKLSDKFDGAADARKVLASLQS